MQEELTTVRRHRLWSTAALPTLLQREGKGHAAWHSFLQREWEEASYVQYCVRIDFRQIRSILYIIAILFSSSVALTAQKFHFGGNGALILSQVDGDNLRGFNKIGFNAGLLSGYAFNDVHSFVVELQYASLGSKQKKEVSAMRMETELKTLNILCAYSLRFGDAWDGSKKFRLLIGPRIHAIQASTLQGNKDKDLLDRYLVTGHVGIGVFLSESFILDLSYNHGLTNILQADYLFVDKLNPYYLSLGLVYYLLN